MNKEELKKKVTAEIQALFNSSVGSYHEFENTNRQIRDLIDQLDEPEVLSSDWIKENIVYADVKGGTEAFINVDDLQNPFVPKQEEQSAKTVADVIADFYKSQERLKEVLGTKVEELEE